jgi:hypothetical protein
VRNATGPESPVRACDVGLPTYASQHVFRHLALISPTRKAGLPAVAHSRVARPVRFLMFLCPTVYSSWMVGNWEVDFRLARRSEANAPAILWVFTNPSGARA